MANIFDNTAQFVVKLLNERGERLASAESCTGGMISAAITSVSGASDVFDIGMCTYANEMKHKYLGVPLDILDKYGAVSPECAEYMANGIRKAAGTDYGIITTGIAGPTGGTADKPVGTVYIACSSQQGTEVIRLDINPKNADGDVRAYIREESVCKALLLVQRTIERSQNG